MSSPKKLNQVKPREQVGSRTGQQYEYQYCQVANECFGLFETSEKVCVFCEWHDDFVTEHQGSTTQIDIYSFSQVKTKSLNNGPWKLNEVLGAGGKGRKLNLNSPFFRMFQTFLIFKNLCRKFIFVTNSGISSELTSFLEDISQKNLPDDLEKNNKNEFEKIWEKYSPEFDGGEKTDFFQILKKFEIQSESGKLGEHIELLRTKIQDRVKDFCEIDLRGSEARRITENIVDLVRKKSQVEIKKIPLDEEDLKKSKAISAEDLLEHLPLSKGGLRALQNGNQDIRTNILALSRLHRLCNESNIPNNLVEQICQFKVKWDLWIQDKKHDFDDPDFEALKLRCLQSLSEKNELKKLGEAAKEISKEFNPKLQAHLQIDESLVLGFMFSLASQMEGGSDG